MDPLPFQNPINVFVEIVRELGSDDIALVKEIADAGPPGDPSNWNSPGAQRLGIQIGLHLRRFDQTDDGLGS